MSLTISSSRMSSLVEVSRFITGPFFSVEFFSQEMLQSVAAVRVGDFFASMEGNFAFFLPLHVKAVGHALMLPGYTDDGIETNMVSYPTSGDLATVGYDWNAYGNVIHGAYQILLGSLANVYSPSLEKENYTRHYSFSGQLLPQSIRLQVTPRDLVTPMGTLSDIPMLDEWSDSARVFSLNPLSLHCRVYPEQGNAPMPTYDLLAVLRRLQRHGHSSDIYIGLNPENAERIYDWKSITSHVRFRPDGDSGIIIEYHTDCSDISNGIMHSWNSKLHVFSSDLAGPSISADGTVYYLKVDLNSHIEFSFSDYSATEGTIRQGPSSFMRARSGLKSGGIFLTVPSSDELALEKFDRSWVTGISSSPFFDRLRYDFMNAVNDDWSNFVPSTSFSTVDAISMMEGSINNNVLQTLAKIPQIASSLPDIVKGVGILGKLVKRDLSFATLRDIMDLATSTHLQAEFQWRPYYELLTRHLPKIVLLLSQMFREKRLSIGYGTFTFDINDDLGREEVRLFTRTKVIVDVTLTGAMSAALAIDAAGLLPRFSRAWDLIPFTFMVNWITGVGKMLAQMETLAFSALVPAAYVHSYTITSPFTKGELELLSASTLGETPTGLKVYIRDKTLYPPIPRFSRFAFGVPTKFPSTGLLGSLFYQLFLS